MSIAEPAYGTPEYRDQGERKRLTKCAETFYLVEASSCEVFYLWCENDRTKRHRWQEESLGYWWQIGDFGGMPVCCSITWAIINGKRVAFFEGTSQVVDHRMIEAWLKTEFPNAKGTVNAMNFHNCAREINQANEAGNG